MNDQQHIIDESISATGLVFLAVAIGLILTFSMALWQAHGGGKRAVREAVQQACGPCDSVRTCGEWACSAGVEGWHLDTKEKP